MTKFPKNRFAMGVMAGVFSFSLLAACGGGEEDSGDSGDSGGTEDSDTSEASGSEGLSGGDSEGEEGDFHIDFTTASETGLYYPIGAVLADFWQNEVDGVSASSQASNGSVQNMNFMSQGEADVGLVMGNILQEAYEGERGFEEQPYEGVRILAGIYPNYNQVVMKENADIDSLADLEGQDFAPGATGSGTEIASQHILEAYGLSFEDVKTHFADFPEATDLLRNNQAVGANINSGIPTSAVSEMISTADGELVSIDDEQIQSMVDNYDFYIEETIPAGTYDGQEEDVQTTAMQNFLVADESMPEDVAYEITKTMWENLEELEGSNEVFTQFDIEKVTEGAGEVPLHPGAEKYYEEEGVLE
ncbi:TAXI family TRAP transporter solute-binding subunit [Alteribacillus sp. HJP-4]|uniref:TAXI family TRAP transporter solute-binding subunit n=1 Tax=Alteribacillus sp. HJP-4 TaxID=2775394 RepID=UPI0035CD00C1